MRDDEVDSITHHGKDHVEPGFIRSGRTAPAKPPGAEVPRRTRLRTPGARLSEESGPEPPPFSWISSDLGKPAVDLEDKDSLNSLLDR